MPARLTFAAKLIIPEPMKRPQRIQRAGTFVTAVKNPATGRVLWVPSHCILNVIEGVAAVSMVAWYSASRGIRRPGVRTFINSATGNTFLMPIRNIENL